MVQDIKYEDISESEDEQMADQSYRWTMSPASSSASLPKMFEDLAEDLAEYTTALIPLYDTLGELDADWALIKLEYTLHGDRFGATSRVFRPSPTTGGKVRQRRLWCSLSKATSHLGTHF